SALHREQYATQTRSSCSSISFTPSFPSPLLLLLVYVAVDIRGVVPLRCDHTRLLTRLRAALAGYLQARVWCSVVVNLRWWLARESNPRRWQPASPSVVLSRRAQPTRCRNRRQRSCRPATGGQERASRSPAEGRRGRRRR